MNGRRGDSAVVLRCALAGVLLLYGTRAAQLSVIPDAGLSVIPVEHVPGCYVGGWPDYRMVYFARKQGLQWLNRALG